MAATSVAAADLPSGKASPVKYVQICDAYGSGFFTVPGTDTCTRLGGAARFETQYTPGRNIYSIATGALTQSASLQDTNGFEARGIIYVDSRTPTQLGDARTYVRIRAANTSGDRSQGAANNFDTSYKASSGSKTGITLERAYVTWGGFTFGNMSSEWAGLWPSGTFVGGAADFTAGWTNGVKGLAYTQHFGGGWTANVSLQDRSDTGPNNGFSTPSGLTIPVQVSNTSVMTPSTGIDLIGVIRNEGAWGGAEFNVMTGNNSVGTYNSLGAQTGNQSYASWAVNSTVQINLPMIAAGDAFYVNVGYGVGANAYATKSKVLIASCGNGVAKVLDPASGRELASIPIGNGADSVIYDPKNQVAFMPCGEDGVLEVIDVKNPKKISKLQSLKTAPLARTGAIDADGRLYLMAAEPDPSKPKGGGGRPTPKDGSFQMLVMGR